MVKGVVSCTPVLVGEGSERKRARGADGRDFVFDKKRTKL